MTGENPFVFPGYYIVLFVKKKNRYWKEKLRTKKMVMFCLRFLTSRDKSVLFLAECCLQTDLQITYNRNQVLFMSIKLV